jgi:hypothetical protein
MTSANYSDLFKGLDINDELQTVIANSVEGEIKMTIAVANGMNLATGDALNAESQIPGTVPSVNDTRDSGSPIAGDVGDVGEG